MPVAAHLTDLLRHNAWANHTVLEAFSAREQLLDALAHDGESLRERASHLVRTEHGFLGVMRGDTERQAPPESLAGMLAFARETGEGLVDVASRLSLADLAREHFVPWWERDFPMQTLIAQVLAHSNQHRAELAWELARAGINTGEIDFVVWKAGGEPSPGEKPDLPGDDEEWNG